MEAEGYIVRDTEYLEDVLQFLKPERYQVFYLVDESGKIVSTVSEKQLINAFFKYGSNISFYKVK